MTAFRIVLVLIILCVMIYTGPVIAEHGLNLFAVFFGDIAKMGWPGQFNVDFMCMLFLSGLWMAWRNQFSPAGCSLGILGFFGGAPVLCAYLLVTSFQTNGDINAMLLGEQRARRQDID